MSPLLICDPVLTLTLSCGTEASPETTQLLTCTVTSKISCAWMGGEMFVTRMALFAKSMEHVAREPHETPVATRLESANVIDAKFEAPTEGGLSFLNRTVVSDGGSSCPLSP
jgi:hypothetical protein